MGIFSKFKKGLQKGSAVLQGAFNRVAGRKTLDLDDLLDIEEALYSGDFGPETTEQIIEEIKRCHREDKEFTNSDITEIARKVLAEILDGAEGNITLGGRNPKLSA